MITAGLGPATIVICGTTGALCWGPDPGAPPGAVPGAGHGTAALSATELVPFPGTKPWTS